MALYNNISKISCKYYVYFEYWSYYCLNIWRSITKGDRRIFPESLYLWNCAAPPIVHFEWWIWGSALVLQGIYMPWGESGGRGGIWRFLCVLVHVFCLLPKCCFDEKCSPFGKSGEKRTVKIHEKPGKNGEKRPFFIHELHRFMQH